MRNSIGARVTCIIPENSAGFANVRLSRSNTGDCDRLEPRQRVHFSPELSFVIECCRSAFGPADTRPPLSFGALDYARMVRLARFHGVQGLVWRAVGAAGSSNLGDLRDDAAAIAASNLKV